MLSSIFDPPLRLDLVEYFKSNLDLVRNRLAPFPHYFVKPIIVVEDPEPAGNATCFEHISHNTLDAIPTFSPFTSRPLFLRTSS